MVNFGNGCKKEEKNQRFHVASLLQLEQWGSGTDSLLVLVSLYLLPVPGEWSVNAIIPITLLITTKKEESSEEDFSSLIAKLFVCRGKILFV